MNTVGAIHAKLQGGPMDGDSIVISAMGSVGPPQQLCYLTTRQDMAAWMVYEAEHVMVGEWPTENTEQAFQFVGYYNLWKGRIL